MAQGDDSPPGERRCPDCDQRWYSAALLGEDEAECPDCGCALSPAAEESDT